MIKKMGKALGKTLKWFGIVLGGLIVVLIIAALVVPYFLPLDKIKDMAAEKASEAINRQVKIGKVSFNLFKGIELRNLSVSNRPGFSKEPFISAGLIELKYDFWALLRGKVAVDKVVLVKPEILIETRADKTSNYSDLVGVKKPAPKKPVTKKPGKKPSSVSLLVSKFAIKDAKLTMRQDGKITQLKDFNLDISNITLDSKKPIKLSMRVTGVYEGKEVPISVNGNIWLHLDKSLIKISNLDISAAGEKIGFSGEISKFDTAPQIKVNIYSGGIDTDKFLAIVSGTGTKKPKTKAVVPYGVQTRNIDKSMRSIPANIKLQANVDIRNIQFKEMKLDRLALSAVLSNKVLTLNLKDINAYGGKIAGIVIADLNVSGIAYNLKALKASGFDATSASNDVIDSFLTKLPDYKELKNKMYGTLSFGASLSGKGVETPDIISNIKGNGSFLLAEGKVTKIKSLAAIGSKIGIKTLENDIDLKEFKAGFSVANKVVTIKGMNINNGDAGDLKVAFDGSANISSLEFIKGNRLSLKLNPRTTKLSAEYDPFKDEKGWYSLDFEMVGALKKPIPMPKFEKAVQQMFDTKKKELENAAQKQLDAKKKEVEDAAQKEIDRAKQEAEDKAKQELEEKAKELLKF